MDVSTNSKITRAKSAQNFGSKSKFYVFKITILDLTFISHNIQIMNLQNEKLTWLNWSKYIIIKGIKEIIVVGSVSPSSL